MAPKLYMTPISPAVRSVLLLSKALDIELELHTLDLANGEHLSPQYIRINPQHTVPALDDDGFIICDSHAINVYLMNVYAKDKSLYPEDFKKRAIIDQRLHFDSGLLFPKFATIMESIIKDGAKIVSKDKAHALTTVYYFLEAFLQTSTYVAGKDLSIADFSIATTITSANVLVPVAENRFPRISKWLDKMKTLPYYKEGNEIGLEMFTNIVKSKLK